MAGERRRRFNRHAALLLFGLGLLVAVLYWYVTREIT
ncbi:hypothetical protein AFFFEF_01936 [Methylorubrum extorquens]